MGHSTVFAATVCAALLASAPPSTAEPGQESLGRTIDQVVTRVPACVGLAIGAIQGGVRVQRFYGDAGNHRRPRPDTEFEIGSITKTLTATLLAFEDSQGTMRLGDPLARYAPPGFRVPNFNSQPIRLVHLAEHTSGLPRIVPQPTAPMSPERLWRFIGTYQLQHAPGEQFLYSNLGFALLARAIVRRSHESEDQLYARVITGPLGMPDTAIEMKPAQRPRLAQGFAPNGQAAPAVEFVRGFPAMAGAGGARSTLDDMMRYLDFELGWVDVPLRSLLPALQGPRHAAGRNGSVGLGWQMHDDSNVRTIFKGGAVPGFSSYVAFAPSRGTGVVVLANQTRCAVQKIASQIMSALNGANGQDLPVSDDEP